MATVAILSYRITFALIDIFRRNKSTQPNLCCSSHKVPQISSAALISFIADHLYMANA